jgi:hypothetical protein
VIPVLQAGLNDGVRGAFIGKPEDASLVAALKSSQAVSDRFFHIRKGHNGFFRSYLTGKAKSTVKPASIRQPKKKR